ncbi:4'-phosphopantetheinyl transferase family protein [Pantoea sp. FN0307]|uniref:4'-phosphopantetheinyl transferase family protein n=1 Tax=Pantoea sp. FN0307 TaxID=3418560 RepID=UPI003CF2D4BF
MFTFEMNNPVCAFIRRQQTGFVAGNKAVKVCLVEFDHQAYLDTLFAKLAVPLPNALTSAVAKRRADYLAGRYAAHQLLSLSGCNGTVNIGPDRLPVWPSGWNGSISHTSHWAIAVISPLQYRISLGVDIETSCTEIIREIATSFTNHHERALLSRSSLPIEIALLIVFSAKESLFKALFPQAQHIFGFEAAILCELNPQHNSFTFRLTQRLSPTLPAGYVVTGVYSLQGNKVITLVMVRMPSTLRPSLLRP